MRKSVLFSILAFAGFSSSGAAQIQPYYCPPAEDVWALEKEFPDAPAWRYEARVRGNWLADERLNVRRPVPTSRLPARNTSPARGGATSPAQNRPRMAPMLTHARAVRVEDRSATFVEVTELPPVMAALDWLGVEMTSSGIMCRYSLQDGRMHQAPVRPAEALIPINRRDCEPLHNTIDWGYDNLTHDEVCNTSRTVCQFVCGNEAVLESW